MEDELSDFDPADDILVEDDRVITIPSVPVFHRSVAPRDFDDPEIQSDSTESDSDSSLGEGWEENADFVEPTDETTSIFQELGGFQLSPKYSSGDLLDHIDVNEKNCMRVVLTLSKTFQDIGWP